MKIRRLMLLLLVVADLAVLPALAKAQSLVGEGSSSASTVDMSVSAAVPPPDLAYIRRLRRQAPQLLVRCLRPYPIVGAGIVAGINQIDNSPPEWKQGAEGFSKRFGSDFGIAAATTTTRYALSEALREDTLYYRCECKGVFPRLKHAVVSTFTARRGVDGHRVFLFPIWLPLMPAL